VPKYPNWNYIIVVCRLLRVLVSSDPKQPIKHVGLVSTPVVIYRMIIHYPYAFKTFIPKKSKLCIMIKFISINQKFQNLKIVNVTYLISVWASLVGLSIHVKTRISLNPDTWQNFHGNWFKWSLISWRFWVIGCGVDTLRNISPKQEI